MKHHKLKNVAMTRRQVLNNLLQRPNPRLLLVHGTRLDESIIDLVRNERIRQVPEILLENASDAANIQFDVELNVDSALKLVLNLAHLCGASRLAIDSLHIHTPHLNFLNTLHDDVGNAGSFEFNAGIEFAAKYRD